jgi:DNA-binding MarR family transcriptional regulator
VLLAFTLDFEREAELSLAMSANVLRVVGESGVRVVGERGVRVRDLSRLTGVSKEAVAVSVGFLERRGYVEVAPDPTAARTKVVRLKPKGRCALDDYRRRLSLVEERWQQRFGHDEIRKLRESLLRIASRRVGEQPIISAGLQPYPGGWRSRKPYLAQTIATLRDPGATLPHYPTVLHRGGWPDGS